MIKIERKQNPLDAYKYAHKFLGEIGVEQLSDELHHRLKNFADETLFLVAEKEGELVGFITAWIIPERDYVWVDQCWYSPELQGKAEGTQLMIDGGDELEKWALSHFRKKLRMQTRRQAWAKRWGYEEILTVMQKEIS